MGQSNWEADKILAIFSAGLIFISITIFLKRNLQATAKSFMAEAKVSMDPVAIDVPRGFLFEWWSVFWDIFIARTNDKHSEVASSYIEAQQMKLKEQQHLHQLQMQQYQLMPQRHHQLQQSAATVLTGNIYDACAKNSATLDSGVSTQLLDARMDLLKSTANLPGKLCQGNLGNLSVALQSQSQQTSEIKGDLCDSQRSVPQDPSTLYGQEIMPSKSGIVGMSNGLGQGVNNLSMKGWPLTAIDQLSRNFGAQTQRPLSANQLPLLSSQHQALLQVQAQGNLGNPSIGSPMHVGSPSVAKHDQEHLVKSSTQKWLDQLQQQQQQQPPQLQQNIRKRKQPPSGPTNSTGTSNTVGPPLTPTHATSNGVAISGDFPHRRSNSKNMDMHRLDGVSRHASSFNHLDELDFGDIASLDKNEESYLSHDDGGEAELFTTLKRDPVEQCFTFSEAGFIRTNDCKVVCCDFSSDGKYLASAGHEKKVVVWNMDTLETWRSKEEHSSIITDLCFRPETTQLATSSFDATVQLWDSTAPSYKLHTYTGHNSHVTALDFHPKKTDLFCSCDVNGEIRFWSSNPPYECSRVSKDKDSLDTKLQVRFQPGVGQFLAVASDTMVSILDVETDKKTTTIPGHNNEQHSICWHANGDYLAVVSQDSVKVWSLASGKCIHELTSKGNKFRSCIFHSNYTDLLIVGGYQTLHLWNMAENKTMAVQAHADLIAALAHSSRGVLASASHDSYVKIWNGRASYHKASAGDLGKV